MAESSLKHPGGSRIISRILPPAIRLWLSSQLDHVENLVFKIEGRDRDILSGHIPEVSLSAEKAVYQGVHLSQAAVTAQTIRVNLGQVIRRQPLRLLAPFPVSGNVLLTTADFNLSLQSALLGEGIYDFLQRLVHAQPEAAQLQHILDCLPRRTVLPQYQPTADIRVDGIRLHLIPSPGETVPAIAIATQLAIRDGHRLCLENPHWLADPQSASATPLPALHGFEIDLGPEVTLTACELKADYMTLNGTIRVLPG